MVLPVIPKITFVNKLKRLS